MMAKQQLFSKIPRLQSIKLCVHRCFRVSLKRFAKIKISLPVQVFEVSDVAFKDAGEKQRMARNERHVAAIYCNKAAGFEIVHGLLDKLMMMLDVPRIFNGDEKAQRGYYLREAEDPSFSPGRAAHIVLRRGGR